jgi:uncharacterized protein YecE (DUF72 family)
VRTVANILVGTTSWTDKTLIDSGLFYPREARSAEARLRYYAGQFPIVEVDSSYYALPSARNSLLWVERTPPQFVFDIKVFRLFTQHQTPLTALPAEVRRALGGFARDNVYYRDLAPELTEEMWRLFREAIEPLKQAGKLGVVVFQFAPWFLYDRSNLEHLLHCADRLAGYRLAVEFRHRSWFAEQHREQVLRFEREHRLVNVVVDEPQGFASSIPALWEITCPAVAAVRLHGRNRQMWQKKGLASSAERFNYLYDDNELRGFVAPIKRIAAHADKVHVLFNNCYRNYAQTNAAALHALLEKGQAQ